jgi:hypothetical protein
MINTNTDLEKKYREFDDTLNKRAYRQHKDLVAAHQREVTRSAERTDTLESQGLDKDTLKYWETVEALRVKKAADAVEQQVARVSGVLVTDRLVNQAIIDANDRGIGINLRDTEA